MHGRHISPPQSCACQTTPTRPSDLHTAATHAQSESCRHSTVNVPMGCVTPRTVRHCVPLCVLGVDGCVHAQVQPGAVRHVLRNHQCVAVVAQPVDVGGLPCAVQSVQNRRAWDGTQHLVVSRERCTRIRAAVTHCTAGCTADPVTRPVWVPAGHKHRDFKTHAAWSACL